jgi:hypothetical protein
VARTKHIDLLLTVNFNVETVESLDQVAYECKRCGQELDKLYSRNEYALLNPFELLVLKCPLCKAVTAYFIDNPDDDFFDDGSDHTEPMNDQSYPMRTTRKGVTRKQTAVYLKAISQKEENSRQLNKLVEDKLPELYKIGLSLATINLARSRVAGRTESKISTRKLTVKLAAAIYAKANNVTTIGSLWKHNGEGVTERELEEIFGISRKTIRKWAPTFS